MKTKTISLLSLLVLAAQSLPAADWTRFRGPNGTGAATDAKPPTTWSDSQNLKWKLALPGPGSSSPVVIGGRVYVTCYSGYGDGSAGSSPDKLKRHLVCVNRADGKILWDKTTPAEVQEDPYSGFLTEHGYASSTPVVDGERVYVFYGKTGVLAFDLDGKELWRVNVGKSSGNRRWGSAASLMLVGDKLIVNSSEESRSIRALDRKTGKELWKADADSLELSYGTPALIESDGRTDLVISVAEEIWGLNPDTGKLRWYASTGLPGNVSPSVIAVDGLIVTVGGFPKTGSVAVRGGGKGDVTKTHIAWESANSSYIPTPVAHEGKLYVVNDAGFATCLDAKTGALIYKERVSGAGGSGGGGGRGGGGKPFYASPVLANGNIYAMSRKSGAYVIAAKGEFELVAQNKFASDASQFNATPAIAGDQLFLRSDKFLYCVAPAGAQ